MSKYYKKKVKIIDNIDVNIEVPIEPIIPKADDWKEYDDRMEEYKKITATLQKKLRSWWSGETTSRFILVCTQNNKKKLDDKYSVKVELTQLNLDKDTIDRFKEGAKRIVNLYFS